MSELAVHEVSRRWADKWTRDPDEQVREGVLRGANWVLARHPWSAAELYAGMLVRHCGVQRETRAVEAGCGWAAVSFALALRTGCHVTCFDVSAAALEWAQQLHAELQRRTNVRIAADFRQGDLLQEGLAADYDVAHNEGVLEHWFAGDEIVQVVRAMAALVRPGGSVAAWVPNAHLFYALWPRFGFVPPVEERPIPATRLGSLFRSAGLADVRTDLAQPYITPFMYPRQLRRIRALALGPWALGTFIPAAWTRPLRERFALESFAAGTKQA